MAIKKVFQQAKDALGGEKKKKGNDFMTGLKNWITSPGGIITLILIAGVVWYVHSRTEEA